jgi:hypothetical protein
MVASAMRRVPFRGVGVVERIGHGGFQAIAHKPDSFPFRKPMLSVIFRFEIASDFLNKSHRIDDSDIRMK